MKKTFLVILLFLSFIAPSCKKFVQQQEMNYLIKIMTTGVWVVTHYLEDTSDITASFAGYSFQFKSDGTVVGIKAGVSTMGTWSGNINSKTISANFGSAGNPLNKLNDTWKITDSYIDSVAAKTTVNSKTNILNMKKY